MSQPLSAPQPLSDIEIARSVTPRPLAELAGRLGLNAEALVPYGRHKAKLPLSLIDEARVAQSKLVLVTAISPTPAGEGKTTVSVGLSDGLSRLGERVAVALREPSLGPVFGIKGGAAGGGRSQVIPMEDINLHFTGDFSAVEKANNLLAAMIDNRLHSPDPELLIDPRSVTWKRVMDMNDRALRQLIVGLGGQTGGVPREAGFNITAASEVMAILSLARDLPDLKARLERIYVGDTLDKRAVTAKDLRASEAMAILLKEAIEPNLVQTLEGTPAFLHAGPFANIAQGTNSLIATKMAMSHAEWVVTEAGFGSDLGAEKFLNIKCRLGGVAPRAIVLVATVKALKYHGGVAVKALSEPNAEAVRRGLCNLEQHLEHLGRFGAPVVVALNAFAQDTDEEREVIKAACEARGVRCVLSEGWARGGEGCEALAQAVTEVASPTPVTLRFSYELSDSAEVKLHKLATEVYGAQEVQWSAKAKRQLKRFVELGYGELPLCVAKTQKSFSDDASLRGRPTGFTLTVRELEIAAGAGFLIPICGDMLRMPGLPYTPAAEGMRLSDEGVIEGLS